MYETDEEESDNVSVWFVSMWLFLRILAAGPNNHETKSNAGVSS